MSSLLSTNSRIWSSGSPCWSQPALSQGCRRSLGQSRRQRRSGVSGREGSPAGVLHGGGRGELPDGQPLQGQCPGGLAQLAQGAHAGAPPGASPARRRLELLQQTRGRGCGGLSRAHGGGEQRRAEPHPSQGRSPHRGAPREGYRDSPSSITRMLILYSCGSTCLGGVSAEGALASGARQTHGSKHMRRQECFETSPGTSCWGHRERCALLNAALWCATMTALAIA